MPGNRSSWSGVSCGGLDHEILSPEAHIPVTDHHQQQLNQFSQECSHYQQGWFIVAGGNERFKYCVRNDRHVAGLCQETCVEEGDL